MNKAKVLFKRSSHSWFIKGVAGFGLALYRYYENRNHDKASNGEVTVIRKIASLKPEVVIDGGANLGEYSLLVNRYSPQSSIYAFEPVEITYKGLQDRTREFENIHTIYKGLFSEACIREIHIHHPRTHSTIYELKGSKHQTGEHQQIELIRGDDFLAEQEIEAVDFMKLDLEGADFDALMGFRNAFREKRIKAVQFEYGYINITTKKLLVDFYEFFREYGYVVGKIYPKTVKFRDYEFKYEDFLGPNHMAVNENEQELIRLLERR